MSRIAGVATPTGFPYAAHQWSEVPPIHSKGLASHRKRKGPTRLTSDNCRTCRDRKLKCDKTRPTCRKCAVSGRECGGYDIWEVQLAPLSQENDIQDIKSIDQGRMYQAQLLSNYLEQYFPQIRLAAPRAAHNRNASLLCLMALSSNTPPMLESALQTIVLSHIATNQPWMANAAQMSYTELLSNLQTDISKVLSGTMDLQTKRRDIVATSIALSLVPRHEQNSQQGINESSLHLSGGADLLRDLGPFVGSDGVDFANALLPHLHVYAMYKGFAQRKETGWNAPQWRNLQQLRQVPNPWIPIATRFKPPSLYAESEDFALYTCSAGHLLTDFTMHLPSLLERTDNFVRLTPAESYYEFQRLVQDLSKLEGAEFRKISNIEARSQGVALISAADEYFFDVGIEEQAFMYFNASPFGGFYLFENPVHMHDSALVHQLCLLASCALLQVLYSAAVDKGISLDGLNIRMVDVEQRAYWHAAELCRSALNWSRRSLTALIHLESLLCCARNFFESHGDVQETVWSANCALATRMRIERLRVTSTPSLCRIEDFAAEIADGCRYGQAWRTGE